MAFGSIRMEPVFMILGQSAATAAVMAIDANQGVQDVPYAKLRERLMADGQVLEYSGPVHSRRGGRPLDKLPGVIVDDGDAKLTGNWQESGAAQTFIANGYRHEGNSKDGKAMARFEAKLPKAGRYEVRLAYTPNNNRASNVPVEIRHAGGTQTMKVNQKRDPSIESSFVSLGVYEFAGGDGAAVTVSNAGVDGYVVIDAVQWIPEAGSK
jgi:hypothetical protein